MTTERGSGWCAAVAGLSCVVAVACSQTKVTKLGGSAEALPRPVVVLVHDLAVSPEEVRPDRGVGPRVASAIGQTPRTEQELEIGHRLAAALTERLVADLRKRGLDAQSGPGAPPAGAAVLEVAGEFLSIDGGNRTARVVVGLGMGRTDVKAAVVITEAVPERTVVVRQLVGDAKSGFKPGIAESLGVGAVATTVASAAATGGALAVGSEAFSASIDADAKRMGSALAKEIVQVYRERGWAVGR